MSLSKAEAAKRLGIPEREVLEVAGYDDDSDQVVTHDGVSYRVTDDQVEFLANFPKDTLFPVHEPPEEETVDDFEAVDTEPAGGDGGEGEQDEKPDDEPVPDGSVGAVLAWVNRDQARAARALKAERDRPEPRVTLVEQLERLAHP